MKVLGIDPSLNSTGIVVLGLEPGADKVLPWSALVLRATRKDSINRCLEQAKHLHELVDSLNPEVAVIEGYSYGSSHHMVDMAMVGTILRVKLRQLAIPYWDVAPKTLKKFATGSGNASKKIMREKIEETWGFRESVDDIVDAYGLARLGLAASQSDPMIGGYTKAQHESIALVGAKVLSR